MKYTAGQAVLVVNPYQGGAWAEWTGRVTEDTYDTDTHIPVRMDGASKATAVPASAVTPL